MNQALNKPNVLLILTDDQGAWAMGCAGNPDIRTPNLDRLAATGMRFSNFFCASPVCSPARASLFTGTMPSQHGVHDWIRSGNVNKEQLPEALRRYFKNDDKAVNYLDGLTIYPEVLSDNGYTCGLSGKWHLGDNYSPAKGFDHWFALGGGGSGYYEGVFVKDGHIAQDTRYITEVITEDALGFLQRRKLDEKPFYLSVHYTAPHTPWERNHHPAKYFAMYEDCRFEHFPDLPVHPQQINSCTYGTGEKRLELLKGYCAAITAMDENVGHLLDFLDNNGLRENTLVIFTSDNGMNTGHHGIWGKGNGTFPQNMYDTSVKVPFIASRPGSVPQNLVNDELLSHYDVFPTLLDYLELRKPDSAPAAARPGFSFSSLLKGNSLDEREHVVVGDEYGPVRMIRNREWKYIHRFPYGPHELYHLADDPDEQLNLVAAPECQGIVESMRKTLLDWFLKYSSPERDGTKEAVTGKGQSGLVGTGKQAFYDDFKHVVNNQPEK